MLIPKALHSFGFDVVETVSMRQQRFTSVRPSRPRELPSRPEEFHFKPLTEPDVILSHLPARAIAGDPIPPIALLGSSLSVGPTQFR
jgi:hypothetical protein